MGWGDRFKERMRQGTHISKDLHHFKGTDNERVKHMLKESDEFASRLKNFKKHIHENSSAITGLIKSTHKTLSTPLPRIYERESETNNVVPSMTQDHSAASFRVSDMTAIGQRMESDLQTDIYGPINQWLDIHKEFSAKLTQLENRRLEFDNARRLHGRAELERVRSLQKHDRVESEVAAKLDVQNADADAKRLAFTQYEYEVHAQLSGLITDAANMHSVMAHGFRILGGAMSSVVAGGAQRLTHEQMTGAPHALQAVEHQRNHTNLSGGPAGQAPGPLSSGSGNYRPSSPRGSQPLPPTGSGNFAPPMNYPAQPAAGFQAAQGNRFPPIHHPSEANSGQSNPFVT